MIASRTWSILNTTGALVKGRYGHSSVYDESTGLILVHGGYHSQTFSAYVLSDALYAFSPNTSAWFVYRVSFLFLISFTCINLIVIVQFVSILKMFWFFLSLIESLSCRQSWVRGLPASEVEWWFSCMGMALIVFLCWCAVEHYTNKQLEQLISAYFLMQIFTSDTHTYIAF